MTDKTRPTSLDGRWDILYRDYPEVYHVWGRIPKVPDFLEVVAQRFDLTGAMVVDVGAGSGLSTRKLARFARHVIGVEIARRMTEVATAEAPGASAARVTLVAGAAEALPLHDDSVDVAIGVTLADQDPLATEAEMARVVRPGGLVLRGDVAPGWYGGDVMRAVKGNPPETAAPGSRDALLAELGYDYLDVTMDQHYESVEQAVATYGFIHGQGTIAYIRAHRVTTIRWKARARFKVAGPAPPMPPPRPTPPRPNPDLDAR